MIDPALIEPITKAVDAAFKAEIDDIAALVRYPSTRGAEQTAQDEMARQMRARGLDVDRFAVDVDAISHLPGFSPVRVSYENAINVVGAHRATGGGRSLILNGHIDVVPIGNPARWTTPAFEPRREGNWLYGRGAGDMKAGLVACLYAYDAVRAAGFAPQGDIFVQSVVEEECTGNGALACLARGYRADCAIVPEPFGPCLMRAQTGPVWFTVTVEGAPEHASGFQTTNANAIEKAMAIWNGLKALEADWNARAKDHDAFHDHPHPIRFNLGVIRGGEWASSAPSSCTFEARCAVLPGWDLAAARAQIRAAIAGICRDDPFLSNTPATVDFHGFMAEGYTLPRGTEQEATLAAAHEAIVGSALTEHVTPAATDARFFGLYQDTPALVYGPVCENAHGYDERVDIDSVRTVTKTLALFIAGWCGVAPN